MSITIDTTVVSAFTLSQNYPNPFNPATTIPFALAARTPVSLKVFDLLGSEVATIVDEEMSPGQYSRLFDASHIATGMYIYQLQAGTYVQSRAMMVVK
jgi:hypothetical protein